MLKINSVCDCSKDLRLDELMLFSCDKLYRKILVLSTISENKYYTHARDHT